VLLFLSLSISPLIVLFPIEEQDTQLLLIQEMFPLATLLLFCKYFRYLELYAACYCPHFARLHRIWPRGHMIILQKED